MGDGGAGVNRTALRPTRPLAPTSQSFEPVARLRIERALDLEAAGGARRRRPLALELAHEAPRGARSTHGPAVSRTAASDETTATRSLPRRSAARRSTSVSACLAKRTSSESDASLLALAVEHDHAAGAAQRDEAGQPVDELVTGVGRPGVQQVVAVEHVKRRLGHAPAYLASSGSVRRATGAEWMIDVVVRP